MAHVRRLVAVALAAFLIGAGIATSGPAGAAPSITSFVAVLCSAPGAGCTPISQGILGTYTPQVELRWAASGAPTVYVLGVDDPTPLTGGSGVIAQDPGPGTRSYTLVASDGSSQVHQTATVTVPLVTFAGQTQPATVTPPSVTVGGEEQTSPVRIDPFSIVPGSPRTVSIPLAVGPGSPPASGRFRVAGNRGTPITVSLTSGSTAITASAPSFDPSLVGRRVTGLAVPAGTRIAAVAGPTSATLSNAATTTSTSSVLTLAPVVCNEADLWGDLPAGATTCTLPDTDLPVGRTDLDLTWCADVAFRRPLCTPPTRLVIVLAGAPLSGSVAGGPATTAYRHYAQPGQAFTVSWPDPAPGDPSRFTLVSVPTTPPQLVGSAQRTSHTFTVPADAAVGAAYELTVVPCRFGAVTECTNRGDVRAPGDATSTWHVQATAAEGSFVLERQVIAVLEQGSTTVPLFAPRSGMVTENGSGVAPNGDVVGGAVVRAVISEDVSTIQVVVGDAAADAIDAFAGTTPADRRFDAHQELRRDLVPRTGLPLDVAIGREGDVWTIGEFGDAVAGTQAGTTTAEPPPVRTTSWSAAGGTAYGPVGIYGSEGLPGRSTTSTFGEDVLTVNGDVWFTHGGGYDVISRLGNNPTGVIPDNHSRILRLRTGAVDSPATEHDDRFCVYDVPGDQNSVVGLSWDGERIWFAGLGPFGGTPEISSFYPDDAAFGCDAQLTNTELVDYGRGSSPDVVHLPPCPDPDDRTQHGCITQQPIPSFEGVAHLEFDPGPQVGPSDDVVWFTEFWGGSIGRLGVADGSVTSVDPPPSAKSGTYARAFGPASWQVRYDDQYVYVNLFNDVDLVRVPKATFTSASIEVVHLPVDHAGVYVHSIDLDPVRRRLWFTLHNEGPTPTGASVGWVPLDDWDSGAVVRYSGLDGLVAPEREHVAPAIFDGIDLDACARVAVADFIRRQALVLDPVGGTGERCDTFARPDGDLSGSPTETGSTTWSAPATLDVLDGELVSTATSTVRATLPAAGPDVSVRASVRRSSGDQSHDVRLQVRGTPAGSRLFARAVQVPGQSTVRVQLYKRVGTVETLLATADTQQPLPTSPQVFELTAAGSAVTVRYAGATAITWTLSGADATTFASGTEVGVGLRLGGWRIDDVVVRPV